MKIDELFTRRAETNPEDGDQLAAIRAKAAAFDQQRQQRLATKASRVMSPEQIARARAQGQADTETTMMSPEKAFELFKRSALDLAAQPNGHQVLLQKYQELKGSNDPLARQKRAYIHELLTSRSGFRRGVSAGYR